MKWGEIALMMIYYVDGCTSKKRQEKGQLTIMNFKRATFCFLMSLLFSCVFIVCRLWNLVCYSSWNANAQIKNWWWSAPSWIFFGCVMKMMQSC